MVKHTLLIRAPLFLALFSVLPSAVAAKTQTKMEQKTTTYSVGLSATRLVYTLGSSGNSVTINCRRPGTRKNSRLAA
ncbi:hypothetical protein SAMN05428958_1219 [Pantoea sesami]|nr:hypothetical protein SAMN05428958_1219 [Pantoea sesami]